MSEEIEYLSQEEIDRAAAILNGSKKYYVYYTDEGDIVAIVKEPKDWAKNVLEVDEENVMGFLKGEKTTYNYKINNPALQNNSIVTTSQLYKFNKMPLQVVPESSGNDELVIIHDTDSSSWKIKLDKTKIKQEEANKTISIFVSIKDNHNFLLNTLTFKISEADTVTFPFVTKFENNFQSVDLLTKKIFASYGKIHDTKS